MVIGFALFKERVGLGLQQTTFRGYFIWEDRGQRSKSSSNWINSNLLGIVIGGRVRIINTFQLILYTISKYYFSLMKNKPIID